jgi:hypothetical protein
MLNTILLLRPKILATQPICAAMSLEALEDGGMKLPESTRPRVDPSVSKRGFKF